MSTNLAFLRDDEPDALVQDRLSTPAARGYLEFLKSEPSGGPEILELVQRIFLASAQPSPRLVVFATSDGACDSARISALAAHHLSRAVQGSVCLVDANLRSPSLHTLLGVDGGRGLTDLLVDNSQIPSVVTPLADTLWILPSGGTDENAADLLNSQRAFSRMAALRSQFDWIIVNAPQLGRYADTLAIGRMADGLVLIIEAGATRRETARAAVAMLRLANIQVLGAVLNNRTFPIPDKIYAML